MSFKLREIYVIFRIVFLGMLLALSLLYLSIYRKLRRLICIWLCLAQCLISVFLEFSVKNGTKCNNELITSSDTSFEHVPYLSNGIKIRNPRTSVNFFNVDFSTILFNDVSYFGICTIIHKDEFSNNTTLKNIYKVLSLLTSISSICSCQLMSAQCTISLYQNLCF